MDNTDRVFGNIDTTYSTMLCDVHKELREENARKRKERREYAISRARATSHETFVPIKAAVAKLKEHIGNSDRYVQQRLVSDKLLCDVLCIQKQRNRWMCSHEKLNKLDVGAVLGRDSTSAQTENDDPIRNYEYNFAYRRAKRRV